MPEPPPRRTIAKQRGAPPTGLEPAEDGAWLLRHSSAGHPPLMVRHPDGAVESLDEAGGLLLGVSPRVRESAERVLAPGTTVLAYTDGLVERRRQTLDDGFAALRATAAAAPNDPEVLCDRLVDGLVGSGFQDDVALLAARFG